jgi:hypothetical protein
MAETFRRGRIEDYIKKLSIRRELLKDQLEKKEFFSKIPFISGQLSAIDSVIQELADEFDIEIPERIRIGGQNG